MNDASPQPTSAIDPAATPCQTPITPSMPM
jgi:hypothetical protein